MNKTDCIEFIGDVIVLIDTQRGSLPPHLPKRQRLDGFRKTLNEKQLELADLAFNSNTPTFNKAAKNLKSINKEIKETIDDVDQVVKAFEALKSFVDAVDELFLLAT